LLACPGFCSLIFVGQPASRISFVAGFYRRQVSIGALTSRQTLTDPAQDLGNFSFRSAICLLTLHDGYSFGISSIGILVWGFP